MAGTTWLFLWFALILLVSCQSEQPLGKECSSSYHCWRTEPIDAFGQPLSLQLVAPGRSKRLEIGGRTGSKGGRCRCTEGVCQLFHIPSREFFACEEF